MLGGALPEIAPDRVAVYIRWSTDEQGEGTTLQTQRERCRHYLASQGWYYREDLVYIDDGYSGGSLERPALTRLRTDVAAGRVQCVVVYKIDRLSRSVVDIVDLVLREWEGRCFVKSTTEEVNTLSPTGKMFFYILVSFAEYERSVIRERTMGGKIKRAQQGSNPGFRPPYGYRVGERPGQFAVVEAEAAVVKCIFAGAAAEASAGPGEIARSLNAAGHTRRGRPWTAVAVRRVLANPAYAGILAYGRSTRTSREQRRRQGVRATLFFERPRYAEVAGALPALVAPEVWAAAQGREAGAPTAPNTPAATQGQREGYLLSGLAVCRCGAPVQGKRVGRHRYYCCSRRKRGGPAACDSGHVDAGWAEAQVLSAWAGRGGHPAPAPEKADLAKAVEQAVLYRPSGGKVPPVLALRWRGEPPSRPELL